MCRCQSFSLATATQSEKPLGISGVQLRASVPAGLGPPFDLVFLDPPYGKGLGERALARLAPGGWIVPDARIVFECAADEEPAITGFDKLDARTYGAAKVLFLRPAV